jgi:Holliday junction DNA helicase RuvA
MISYVKGELVQKTPTFVIIEAGGIGYHINISLNTYSAIERLEAAKLFTYLHIKEDAHTLYGFAEEAERVLFAHLLTVSGIGPNTARLLLSAMTPEEARAAIVGEDIQAFNKVKGVGPKTAKRIILDLKDKMVKDGGELPSLVVGAVANAGLREEALQALMALGFAKIQVQKTLNAILREQPQPTSVEGLIKSALKSLSM